MNNRIESISVALDAASIGACTIECRLLGRHTEFCPVRTLYEPAQAALQELETELEASKQEHTALVECHRDLLAKYASSRQVRRELAGKLWGLKHERDRPCWCCGADMGDVDVCGWCGREAVTF